MKKVAVIAYGFPPVGGAGVQRPAKFVKYLREFGWEPVILTVANPSVPVIDESLLDDLPGDITTYTARTLEPSYARKQGCSQGGAGMVAALKNRIKRIISNCLLPDVQILWWPGLVIRLVELIKNEKPDCLFVTAPPFSSFIPVVFLGSWFNIPVVVDFRDEWSFSRATWENAAKHGLARMTDRFFERYSVSRCSDFTAANGSYVASLRKTYGECAAGKGCVITNGYDESDFNPSPPETAKSDGAPVTIVYTGTVWTATSLKPFVTALCKVIDEDTGARECLRVKVYGRVVGAEQECFHYDSLNGVVSLFGYCDHQEITREIAHADILLLTLSDLPGAEKIITGKVFEYMATGKHIFGIVPDGETKNIITDNYSNFTVVHPLHTEEISRSLRSLMDSIHELRQRAGNDVSRFSRRKLTGKLAEVFERFYEGPENN